MQETMTAQEVFDKVYAHLLTQNAKSTNGAGQCRYRGENNRSCAVGCLITDQEYQPSMDGEPFADGHRLDMTSVQYLNAHKLLPERLVPHLPLLKSLQNIHDSDDVNLWKDSLATFALAHNFTIPVIGLTVPK